MTQSERDRGINRLRSRDRLARFHHAIVRPFLRRHLRYSRLSLWLESLTHFSPQEHALDNVMRFASASAMEGDYLEFGVYEGGTFAAAYHLAQRYGLRSMRFFAFDSFQGLPSPSGIDATPYQQFQQGQYALDLASFNRSLRRHGVPQARIRIVPGWYDETLNETTRVLLGISTAAVVWIDCDLYRSAVPALRFVTPLVTPGTIIVFDDWYAFRGDPRCGEQRAFREWLAQNPTIGVQEFMSIGWHGKAFLIHSAPPSSMSPLPPDDNRPPAV